ncbi:hypothetical protein [Streptomyces sp. NBC_01462]|uniref:hypothetical protein n=1 Tax=Streptomyces sp. NBC_01462 TaxID=2903876 RepID=UPI002E36695D|nr:hypothetical protein [Streptomyces sp. NBC_01462]
MSDTPVDPAEAELLLYLGTMVRDAAHMEITVEALTAHLLAGHDPKATPVQGQSLSILVRTCRETALKMPRVDAVQRESLNKLLDRVTDVSLLRNAYVHGGWARDHDDGSFIAVRGKRGQRDLVAHAVSADQLVDMIGEIPSVRDGFLWWLNRDLDALYGPLQNQSGAEPQ